MCVSKHSEVGSCPGGQLAAIWMPFSPHLHLPVNPCTTSNNATVNLSKCAADLTLIFHGSWNGSAVKRFIWGTCGLSSSNWGIQVFHPSCPLVLTLKGHFLIIAEVWGFIRYYFQPPRTLCSGAVCLFVCLFVEIMEKLLARLHWAWKNPNHRGRYPNNFLLVNYGLSFFQLNYI